MVTIREWFMLKKKWLELSEENEMQLLVLSNSMKPNISRGDRITIRGVVGEKICIDDIVVFLHNDKNATVHRVIDISYIENKIILRTKGDANKNVDSYFVSIEDIVGIVKSVTKRETSKLVK